MSGISVVSGYRFAGFWWRVLAYIIDAFILTIVGAVVGGILGFVIAGGGGSLDDVRGIVGILSFVWYWLYFALFESSSLRGTPGKRACGLIVTRDDGYRISFGRATGRYFAQFLSALILCVGFLMAGWTRRKQALHDLICDTLVLKELDRQARITPPQVA
ncbi:MAG: RDD family protein [Stellaceae bacterium]